MSSFTHDIQLNPHILVIDDSKLNRAVVRNTLTGLSMTIQECEHGGEGIDLIQKNKYDLILVDTVMPVMDGISFLKDFKQYVGTDFIPVILMTGSDDLNSKIKGLNVGADDFLQKPINQKELVARVFSLLRLKKIHDQLYEKNEIIRKELLAAKKIQQFIIPEDFSYIEYPKISGYYLPMEDIGGDFFDCYNLPNGDTGFLIADVTGHGIPAALIVTMAKMIFSLYAPKFRSTAALLSIVNTEMRKMLLDNQYITGFYSIYEKEKGILRFTNAGHVRPYLFRRRSNKCIPLDTNGFFMGIIDNTKYEEKAIRIEKGDRLFYFTDGITELKNSNKVDFGEEALSSFIINNKDQQGRNFDNLLIETLKAYIQRNNRADDISFLNIEF
jgi:serine phosphatase RsbU (regulator of sigma subunit)